MSAAAVVPIQPLTPQFLKVESADLQRFRNKGGCTLMLVAALKYRAQSFSPSFYCRHEDMMQWTGGYSLAAIKRSLRKLEAQKWLIKRSDGRGLRITLCDENAKVSHQVAHREPSPIDGNARARQASKPEEPKKEEKLLRSEEQAKIPKPEESGQHRPRQKPVVNPAIDQADKANPVKAAKQIGLYKPERFSVPALRTALWHYRRRVVRINGGGLLYVILMSIHRAMKPKEVKTGNDYAALVEQVRGSQPKHDLEAVVEILGNIKALSWEEEQASFEQTRRMRQNLKLPFDTEEKS